MSGGDSVDVICRYLVKAGKDGEFEDLLGRHWETLHALGLTTEEPAQLFRATDAAGNIAFVEMFAWKDSDSSQTAHETPTVMGLWEPMGALCRDMEFWHAQPIGR